MSGSPDVFGTFLESLKPSERSVASRVPEAPGTSSEAMQNMALLSGIAELNGDSKAVPLAELYKKLPMSFTTMAKSLASLQSGKFIEVETAGTEESVKLTEAGKTIASFARSK